MPESQPQPPQSESLPAVFEAHPPASGAQPPAPGAHPQAFVHPLAWDGSTLTRVGGKAHNLSIMLRAGLPVPEGFVVTTDAYHAFVTANGLDAAILRAWEDARAGDPAQLERASADLRAAFEAGEVPARVSSAILEAYAALKAHPAPDAYPALDTRAVPDAPAALDAGPPPVAVRSSATAEDLAGASFAGQQDTYLNITGSDPVLEAVKRCWGSLWTARAMAYRTRQGTALEGLGLAVVVQRMAPATAAGVMFTVNPVTGARDEMVINATWGLGEALVSGRVNPDTIMADRGTGRVRRADLGDKAVMTVPSGSGTAEVDVEDGLRGRQAVTEAQVEALVRLGRRLEDLFGGPQDVEWAVAGAQVVLLQSRAVTTVAPQAGVPGDDAWPPVRGLAPQPFDFWTQQDMGERWPDPVTPLTWSVAEPMSQINFASMLAGLKAPYAGKIQWTRRFFGHVYMNEGALLHVFTDGFGMPMKLVETGLTHPAARPKDSERWKPGRALRHLGFFLRAATTWERKVRWFEREFDRIDGWVDTFMKRDLSAVSDADLLAEARGLWFDRVNTYIEGHIPATSLSMSAYTQMETLMERWIGDRALAQTLAGGLSGIIAAEMVPALWEMAETLRRLGLEPLVLDNPPAVALERLRDDPRATAFRTQLERFLQRQGHRCMVEGELLYPRWIEAPEKVIESLEGYLRMQAPPGGAVNEEAARRREEKTAEIAARLNPMRRFYFRWALKRLHWLTRMRDNGQGYIVKLMLPMRHLYALLGQRWAERGWIAEADDVFFLAQEELQAVVDRGDPAGAGFELRPRIDTRREAFRYWFTQPVPEALDARGEPVAPAQSEAGAAGGLAGIPASRGTVTGTARVVLTPQEASRLQPGDILVTRATDPGWTPVFSVIGGAVLEIGGLLSHGAIVAREYGIPAVVNVSQATRLIADGQTITVDGGAGRVVLHERPE